MLSIEDGESLHRLILKHNVVVAVYFKIWGCMRLIVLFVQITSIQCFFSTRHNLISIIPHRADSVSCLPLSTPTVPLLPPRQQRHHASQLRQAITATFLNGLAMPITIMTLLLLRLCYMQFFLALQLFYMSTKQ
jgi:hypothetical protein